MTPMIWNVSPLTSNSRPRMAGSRENMRSHPRWLSTITCRPASGSSSPGTSDTADRGVDTEHLEEVARDERPGHRPAFDMAVEVGVLRVDPREGPGVASQRVELAPRERRRSVVARSCAFHREHLVDVRDAIDTEQERAEEREGRGDQPEPESDRRDDGERDQRRARKAPQRVGACRARGCRRALTPRASRHSSAIPGTEPKRARAATRASASGTPSSMSFLTSRSMWKDSSSSSSRST